MYHGNARLTIWARTELIQQVMAGWPQAEVARQFRVSRPTVAKWVGSYREEGDAGLRDRSCNGGEDFCLERIAVPVNDALCSREDLPAVLGHTDGPLAPAERDHGHIGRD